MEELLKQIYDDIHKKYKHINHLMTFGLDVLWRKTVSKYATKEGGTEWLDVCTGTGDLAFELKKYASKETKIYATDFSPPMLEIAKSNPNAEKITFIIADSLHLPFEDNTIDLITISLASRNLKSINNLDLYFKEFHRVLKPNGRFVHFETSQPQNKLIKLFYRMYLKLFISNINLFFSNKSGGYLFLMNSMLSFYSAKEITSLLMDSNYTKVECKKLFFGSMAIHKAFK